MARAGEALAGLCYLDVKLIFAPVALEVDVADLRTVREPKPADLPPADWAQDCASSICRDFTTKTLVNQEPILLLSY